MSFGRDAWLAVLRLYALDVFALATIVLAYVLATAWGSELPEIDSFDGRSNASLVIGALVAAPVIEELIFRSWLSARKFYLAIGFSLVVLLAILVVVRLIVGPLMPLQLAILVGGWLAATLWLMIPRWRDRGIWTPIQRQFAPLFWISSALFGLIHLGNYEDEMSALLLMMVLPQFVCGTILGFARVTIGLWASMALHAMRNGVLIALVLAFS